MTRSAGQLGMIGERDCPVCDGRKKRRLYKQRFSTLSESIQLKGYDVVVCEDCGFAYADAIPDQAWFDSYYSNASKYTYDQREGRESSADGARLQSIADMIAKHLPERKSRILDFGCATGGLLHRLKQAGYLHLLGVEKTKSAGKVAQKLYSVPVVNDSLESLAVVEEPFDLMILSGVLEHICDVRSLLLKTRPLLSRGGLLCIEVPDAVGFEQHVDTPFQEFSVEHINFFSSQSLRNLLARYGFETIEVLRLTRDYTSISKMAVLCGFFRFTALEGGKPAFDRETGPAMEQYIQKSLEEEKAISRSIDELASRRTPLIVWGVGTYTLHLIESTAFRKLNIVAFTDSNRNYQNRTLLEKPVLAPSDLKAYPHPILISTYAFQQEIREQIRGNLELPNDIVTLRERN